MKASITYKLIMLLLSGMLALSSMGEKATAQSMLTSSSPETEVIVTKDTSMPTQSGFTITRGDITSVIGDDGSPTTISQTEYVKINLELVIPTYDVGKLADEFIVVEYTNPSGYTEWYQKNHVIYWNDWDRDLSTLYPDHEYDGYIRYVTKSFERFDVYEGTLLGFQGTIKFYWGYRLKGAPIDAINYDNTRSFVLKVN